MNRKVFFWLAITAGIIVAASACAAPEVSSEPTDPVSPITIGDDLSAIDLCAAIPSTDIETVLNAKLTKTPRLYSYPYTEGTSGCYFEGPWDNVSRVNNVAYVVLTPLEVYDDQTLYQNEEVSGIGDAAYFNGAPDERELWVKLENKVAFVVYFGDVPREEGAKALAKLMIEAIQ